MTGRFRQALSRLMQTPARNSAPLPQKSSATGGLVAFESLRQPVWAPRDYATFAREGFAQNAVVYRCVRMVAEAAASIPLLLYDGDHEIEDHPFLDLVRRPNAMQCTPDLLEAWYGFLLVSGNAYLEAVAVGGALRELHVLRPDRMKVIPGADGWPEAFEYSVAGQSIRLAGETVPGVRSVLHLKLFHPTNDHYGLSPIEAAATAIDLHNTASRWNKALLDNSARPSGALVYTQRDSQLSAEQYERLKRELEAGFQGANNTGRPLLLEGGLDWKSMSLTPKDMDFIEAKRSAAREIALALGVPPMLLGIPGDNTYSNYQEASRALWRQTVLPLATRTAKALSLWLGPAWGNAALELRPDLDAVEALASEREATWTRVEKASFLTPNEKRAATGYGPLPGADEIKLDPERIATTFGPTSPGPGKFNPFHDALGRFTFGPGGEGSLGDLVHLANRRTGAGRLRDATPGQQTRYEIAVAAADASIRRVREVDPTWSPPASLTRPGDAESAIAAQEAIARAAIQRHAEIIRDTAPGIGHNSPPVVPRPGSTAPSTPPFRGTSDLPRGFDAASDFVGFGELLDSRLRSLGHSDVELFLRGSAVTGESFRTGAPFDVGRISDFDVSIVSPMLLQRASEIGISLRAQGERTGPLTLWQLEALGLRSLRQEAAESAGRPVSFMIYVSREAVERRGPSVALPRK